MNPVLACIKERHQEGASHAHEHKAGTRCESGDHTTQLLQARRGAPAAEAPEGQALAVPAPVLVPPPIAGSWVKVTKPAAQPLPAQGKRKLWCVDARMPMLKLRGSNGLNAGTHAC